MRIVRPLLVGSVVTAVSGLVILDSLAPVSGFTLSHYLFTYQDGFVRRALVGSILAAFGDGAPVTVDLPAMLGLGYLAVLVLLVAALVALAWERGDRRTTLLLAALLVGSSQLQILAFDVGKFDGLLLALTAAAALASLRAGRGAPVIVATFGVVGVLVHELHLVAGVPLAAAMVALGPARGTRGRLATGVAVALPAALTGLILALLAGRPPGGSVAAAEALMAARAAFTLEESAAFVQGLSVTASVRQTFGVLLARPVPILTSVLVAVPPAAAALLLLRGRPGGGARGRRDEGVLAVAALSALLLLPLGFDWYRWLTISVVGLIIAGLWTQAAPSTDRIGAPTDGSEDGPGLMALSLVLLSLVLGSVSLSSALTTLAGLLP